MCAVIMEKCIVIFKSTHNAIKAERICQKAGVACQVIPVPRALSSDCGIALEIANSDKEGVGQLLTINTIRFEFRSPIAP